MHRNGGQNLTKIIMQTHESEEEKESYNLHKGTEKRWGLEITQKWGWRRGDVAGFSATQGASSCSLSHYLSF